MSTRYRGYEIAHDPKPIPTRAHDWGFVHEDYDGPDDPRHGTAPSLEEARRAIDEQLEGTCFTCGAPAIFGAGLRLAHPACEDHADAERDRWEDRGD